MSEKKFIKQNHKNIKIAFILIYTVLFFITIFCMFSYNKYYISGMIFLVVILMFFCYITNLFNSYGIYVKNEKVYYKTLKIKEVDLNKIIGIKIIKSEVQVNLAWSPYVMKDKAGETLYSMIFLSEIEDGMTNYTFGDIEFLRKYRENVIMYSIYDESFIKWLTAFKPNIKMI